MCVSIFLVMLHTMVVRVRRPIGFRPPSDENISRSMGKNVEGVSKLTSRTPRRGKST